MKITYVILGKEQAIAKVDRLGVELRKTVFDTVQRLTITLQNNAKGKLSGDVLKVRSGDLRRSINQRMDVTADSIKGTVGAHVPYAAYQEYGFVGSQSVAEHVRRTMAQMVNARYNKLGIETAPSKLRGRGTGETTVRAHTRNVNYAGRSYLRSALAEMSDLIQADLAKALTTATRRI